jgi:tetratricopeptide (TPR) repeat protein
MRDALAQGAIEALLAKHEIDEASELLARVDMPEFLYAMATERLYQPLWPKIEARLGPQAGRAVDRFAAARLEDLARTPDDDHARREAIRAFILLGRYPDAAELAEPIGTVDGMSEDDVISVRYHAQALAAIGQRDKAIERLRGFAALDLDRTPEAVSGLVGLAEMLEENGQPAEALAVAREGLARGGHALSDWGKGWLHRSEVCALGALGRSAEARTAGDALKAAADRNQAAAVEGLLCLARADEAAVIAIRGFATSEGASQLADQFQPEGAIWAPAHSPLRALWASFLTRPDVKAAFERRARILPRLLWPAREPRPIPRKPSADPGIIA